MKQYQLCIIRGGGCFSAFVFADDYGIGDGYYYFTINQEIICCYPISRTIIESIKEKK